MPKSLNIALVVSEFNQSVTSLMKTQAIAEFKKVFSNKDQLSIYEVPGAVELPFIQQEVILKKNVDGVIILGCVIRGETDHYDYVCQMVSKGCMDVSLKHEVPMGFGVITAPNSSLALARCHENKSKACETVRALYDLLQVSQSLGEKND
jgi:6,7-dimethyl-8-ribityllumazine synthase